MNLKKLCTTLAVFTLITSSCAFAQDLSEKELFDLEQQIIQQEDISKDENQQEVVEETIVSEIAPVLRSYQIIDRNIRTDDYDENFWCDESDGKTLNIYIKNNGTQPVQHRITHGNSAVRSKGTIKPGKSVQLRLGPDRSGRWNIDVYTTDGSRMDVKVEARQF